MQFKVEFIRIKSYSNDTSTGNVKIYNPEILQSLRGKVSVNINSKSKQSCLSTNKHINILQHVLVVEDIIDTGLSMKNLIKSLDLVECKSVKVASLMIKRKNVNTFKPNCEWINLFVLFSSFFCLFVN